MKKQLLTAILCAAFGLGASAQNPSVQSAMPVAAKTTAPSKEDKAKQKAQQEQDIADAIKGAGLSDAQATSVRQVLESSNAAAKELKANASLTEEQKTEAKKKINDDKNAKLKDIMGAEGYKKWNEIRREQKARSEANAG